MTNEEVAKKIGYEPEPVMEIGDLVASSIETAPVLMPDFLNSMDACEKWIVPWLRERGFESYQFAVIPEGYACFIWNFSSNEFNTELSEGPTMSQALVNCLENM